MPEGKSQGPSLRHMREAEKDLMRLVLETTSKSIKIVESPVIPKVNKVEEIFPLEKVINGIKINVHWSDYYKKYVLHLPQVVKDEVDFKEPVSILSKSRDEAKMVFDKVCSFAEEETDINEVYERARIFLHTLPFTYEEDYGN